MQQLEGGGRGGRWAGDRSVGPRQRDRMKQENMEKKKGSRKYRFDVSDIRPSTARQREDQEQSAKDACARAYPITPSAFSALKKAWARLCRVGGRRRREEGDWKLQGGPLTSLLGGTAASWLAGRGVGQAADQGGIDIPCTTALFLCAPSTYVVVDYLNSSTAGSPSGLMVAVAAHTYYIHIHILSLPAVPEPPRNLEYCGELDKQRGTPANARPFKLPSI